MHLAQVLSPISWTHKLDPGKYAVEDHNAAEMLWASRGFGEVRLEASQIPAFDRERIWKAGTRVLVVRVGGFGDLLWLNPIYARMREAGVYVGHSCFARYADILDGFVDEWVPYPLRHEDSSRFDEIVWLENAIEGRACLGTEHPATRLAAILNCPLPLPPAAAYRITTEEMKIAGPAWPRTLKPRVCVQLGSSGATKDYPRMPELLAKIHEAGFEVLIVGNPRGPVEPVPDDIFDCSQRNLTIRQSIAMAALCDAIIAPDSVFVHVGHALGIPVVGLFGPFSAPTYMHGYKGVAMQGRGKCSPCSWHPRGTAFPPEGPCAKSGYCNALANIPVKDVLFMLKQALK